MPLNIFFYIKLVGVDPDGVARFFRLAFSFSYFRNFKPSRCIDFYIILCRVSEYTSCRMRNEKSECERHLVFRDPYLYALDE